MTTGVSYSATDVDSRRPAVTPINVFTVLTASQPFQVATRTRPWGAVALATRVADVIPLEQAEAHRRVEAGHRPGRIVLMLGTFVDGIRCHPAGRPDRGRQPHAPQT
ncbi:hypothetical protein GCM10010230_25270 [Streptomyces narbonensis]|nr:hypothetical protein GCM10010230_25270 [Streptomyces narbonensis]